jgi:Tol biopolymer transport system component
MCAGLAVPSVADPVTLVSSGSAGNAVGGSSALVSSSGRYVVFTSSSPDVVAGQVDTNGALDVFLLDRTTATVMLVSRSLAEPTTAGNGPSFAGALSADGRYVLFTSGASDLTATDTNGTDDIFLFDRVTATATLVSRSTAGPITAANGTSRAGAMTANGRYVLFASDATDLTTTDTNGAQDVFLFDLTREP